MDNPDTIGTEESVAISEVSSFRGVVEHRNTAFGAAVTKCVYRGFQGLQLREPPHYLLCLIHGQQTFIVTSPTFPGLRGNNFIYDMFFP